MIRLPVWHLTTLKPIDVAITDTMSDSQEQPLKAAAFSPQVASPEGLAEAGHGRPKWLIPAAIALFIAAIVVFVLLPSVISTDNPATPVLTESATLSGTPTQAGGTVSGDNPGEERSPFAEAQQQKLRKLAQDALQVVLEAQEALQEFSVERWAPEAYAAALAVAAEGDKAYRDRQFVEAAAAYQEAAAGLATLEDSISRRAQEARLKALSAIEAGDASAAKKQYELLTLLEPGDSELPGLLERTAKIPEVAAALETAAESAVKGDMGAAVKAALTAKAEDPEHKRVATLLAQYQEADALARFRKAMSQGYAALDAENFKEAAEFFVTAGQIRPGASEPQSAQIELASAQTAAKLRQLADTGKAQERNEAWADAVATYEEALLIDSTLIYAQAGLKKAAPRAELATALEDILAESERLVDARALKAAETVLAEALTITSRGPVLEGQVSKLEKLLLWAKTPVTVKFTSDEETDVTLLRVRRLGSFVTSELTLRPGRYTALGVRNGYRDVRINFDIKPESRAEIDVRCLEAI
jgi:hypothetical protein